MCSLNQFHTVIQLSNNIYEIWKTLIGYVSPRPNKFQKQNLFCKNAGKDGKYNTLEKAKMACEQKKDCIAVEDKSCDGKGHFTTCFGFKYISKGPGVLNTCIYKKIGNSLMLPH